MTHNIPLRDESVADMVTVKSNAIADNSTTLAGRAG